MIIEVWLYKTIVTIKRTMTLIAPMIKSDNRILLNNFSFILHKIDSDHTSSEKPKQYHDSGQYNNMDDKTYPTTSN